MTLKQFEKRNVSFADANVLSVLDIYLLCFKI